jgi:hypothetical protein
MGSVSSSRHYEPSCPSGFGKVSTESLEVHVAGRLAGEPHLEDPFQQSAKLSQSRQFNLWRPPAEMQRVRSRQETGRFSEANCISEVTEVIVRIGYGPVVHGVDEVEGRMPAYQFELMPPDLSHFKSLSPAKAI